MQLSSTLQSRLPPRKYLCATVFLIIFLSTYIKELNSLRIVALKVPTKLAVGKNADLACLYDMEYDKALLSLKWLFTPNVTGAQEVEFYQYMPKEEPDKKSLMVEQLNVNLAKSNAGRILLTNVTKAAAGTFRCVVEAAETGANDRDDKSMMVYDPAESASQTALLSHFSLLIVCLGAVWNLL